MQYGTERQHHYLHHLAESLGYASIEAALEAEKIPSPTTVEATSQVIELLEQRSGRAARPAQPASAKRFLTARKLRMIATGEAAAPDTLDSDAAWVLQRLSKLAEIERVCGSPAVWAGVNQGGPILTEHLVDFFGSTEAAASAMGVTVPTFRSWGATLPPARAYEAQVKTRNHVCA